MSFATSVLAWARNQGKAKSSGPHPLKYKPNLTLFLDRDLYFDNGVFVNARCPIFLCHGALFLAAFAP